MIREKQIQDLLERINTMKKLFIAGFVFSMFAFASTTANLGLTLVDSDATSQW